MNKLVSVIITTNNRHRLFKRALESVQKQTYKNIEIIVVDGSAIEKTKNYVKKYSDIIYLNKKLDNANVLINH